MGQFQKTPFRDLFTAASAECLNLLARTLAYEPRRRISAREVSLDLPFQFLTLITFRQALDHPYFHAMPYPSHPSKLPKTAAAVASAVEEELDGNTAPTGDGPAVKARRPAPLKRKASALIEPEAIERSRSLARRLDFGAASATSP
jgi:cyclin-dependent kinase 7